MSTLALPCQLTSPTKPMSSLMSRSLHTYTQTTTSLTFPQPIISPPTSPGKGLLPHTPVGIHRQQSPFCTQAATEKDVVQSIAQRILPARCMLLCLFYLRGVCCYVCSTCAGYAVMFVRFHSVSFDVSC